MMPTMKAGITALFELYFPSFSFYFPQNYNFILTILFLKLIIKTNNIQLIK